MFNPNNSIIFIEVINQVMGNSIKKTIESQTTTTFPNGVGSIFRCITDDSFGDLEKKIKEVVLDKIMNDLYCDIKSLHSKEEIEQWVKQM